jgi:hypothetical protein
VCYGHYSSIILLSTAISDGLTWKFEGVVAAANASKTKVDTSYEGPNECTITELPPTPDCAHCTPHLAVMFRESEMRSGAPSTKKLRMQRGAYQITFSSIAVTGAPEKGGEYMWTKPSGMTMHDGLPIGAVQPASAWISPPPRHANDMAQPILALKSSRPGLHIYTGLDARTRSWSHDSNIATIHNKLVTEQSLHFSSAYVASTVGVNEDHAATISKLDAHSFGILYDRGVWSRTPVASKGEKDVVMFMRVHAVWC